MYDTVDILSLPIEHTKFEQLLHPEDMKQQKVLRQCSLQSSVHCGCGINSEKNVTTRTEKS
jgi:hypothetical protein